MTAPAATVAEMTLAPVRRVDPAAGGSFPRLVEPDAHGADLPAWVGRHRSELETALLRDGAVLLRGFDVPDADAFERSAGAICRALEARYGDLVKRPSSDVVYDATWYPKDKAILFHNEGSHTPELPTRQIFYCGRDGFTGGETPIVDSRLVYERMAAELRRTFEDKGLLYIRNFIRGVDVRWQDFFRTEERSLVERYCRSHGIRAVWDDDGGLRISTATPAVVVHPITKIPAFCNQIMLHHVACLDPRTQAAMRAVYEPEEMPRNVCYGDGSPISDETIAEVLRLTVETATRFTWRRGDVLVLDNLAVAHARSPFDGDRQILVAVGDVVTHRSLAEHARAASPTPKHGEISA